MERLLTTEEASKLLNITKRTLERWRKAGKGPKYVTLGRSIGYQAEDIQTWVDDQKKEPGK